MKRDLALAVGGRVVPDAIDVVRRYAGLDWSGGGPEVWAFQYFDRIPAVLDNVVSPVDVLCAASMHPGLSRDDLAFFVDQKDELSAWLDVVDPNLTLWDSDDRVLRNVESLASFEPAVTLSLLTKVLHRKRPRLIPLLDRHVVDFYRPITGERRPVLAWPGLLRAIRADLGSPELRLLVQTAAEMSGAMTRVGDADATIGLLRFIDIAIWMSAR
jgi:hypothetical protein